ncbi:G-type lectin S-receptor-like serine/threonine-protein kinase At5g24080 [Camellia sinensis]|uniref:G-type lectin S-receptor-like serine/threonine-protein kinase At5g24080 n=1 Tax=Camellia sinensis TaxID=4442 RepID=UPI0010369651|nr:G-type lectin S-receptor-like serine/threonine-protein kinase At5g24080 [Camellia sinensis]
MPSLWFIQLPMCPLHGPLTIPYGSSKLRTFFGDQSFFEEAFDRVFLSPSAAILHTLPASLVSSSKKKTSLEQDEIADAPQLVWSANRNHPVKLNATLQLTQDGNLTLADSDGTSVWSTYTGGGNYSVAGLNLTEDGNLVLFDRNNAMVWQSFHHPTDSLLVGQGLVLGQKLTSSTSASNWSQAQFIRLDPDGHLRAYEWDGSNWNMVADLLTSDIGDCGYPMACGNYGICSSNGQCGCPDEATSNTFRQINSKLPNLGCSLVTPISCNNSQYQTFLELKNTSYFFSNSELTNRYYLNEQTELEDCKKSCLKNCSCKAVYDLRNISNKGCFLLSEAFSLINNEGRDENVTVFLKVQKSLTAQYPIPSQTNSPQKKSQVTIILGSSFGAFFGVFLVVASCIFLFKKKREFEDFDEFSVDQVPGMPTKFSYEELRAMTNNFNHKLGEGGFGLVFQGTLSDGTNVAVKRLNGFGQVKKSFLAEVETIGSIHHVNLVRLIGFCAEKSYRLLVYEYMFNGSLDKWIFQRHQELTLGWQSRRKIIMDIAKGLAYLHEDCRQKIFHLDIKPQNILLDEYCNAKISDFGLSKLIDKDQSQVVTTLRGTPGYLAPEWLNSIITKKVDVYSFGVVVLEMLCGRKNLDWSQPEEDMHLLSLFKRKAEEERLNDIVDKCNDEMQLHGAEVVEMMRVAVWCLQSDFSRRPSMSGVVKVLEGSVDVENNLDYNFTNPAIPRSIAAAGQQEHATGAATTLLFPSALSGPR